MLKPIVKLAHGTIYTYLFSFGKIYNHLSN